MVLGVLCREMLLVRYKHTYSTKSFKDFIDFAQSERVLPVAAPSASSLWLPERSTRLSGKLTNFGHERL